MTNWIKYALAVMAGALIVFGISFFKKETGGGIDYKELIKAKDEQIELLKDERLIYERQNERLDAQIKESQRKDSILLSQLTANKQNLKNIDERIKNIPARISRIANNNDSLRRAITDL